MVVKKQPCKHYWMLELPERGGSKGVCAKCGDEKFFIPRDLTGRILEPASPEELRQPHCRPGRAHTYPGTQAFINRDSGWSGAWDNTVKACEG